VYLKVVNLVALGEHFFGGAALMIRPPNGKSGRLSRLRQGDQFQRYKNRRGDDKAVTVKRRTVISSRVIDMIDAGFKGNFNGAPWQDNTVVS
jgi:hypothetical protein